VNFDDDDVVVSGVSVIIGNNWGVCFTNQPRKAVKGCEADISVASWFMVKCSSHRGG